MNEYFIPLPSDPDDLTAEHALAAFRGDLDGVLQQLARATCPIASTSDDNEGYDEIEAWAEVGC